MRIEILDQAQDDLIKGFSFYESREPGLGSYFLDCLFSDIDSLLIYAGIHQVVFNLNPAPMSGIQQSFGSLVLEVRQYCRPERKLTKR